MAVLDRLDDVRALLPDVRLELLDLLGGSPRSEVRRVRAGARTLIVKEFGRLGAGWVRESAALSVMPAGAPTPRLVTAGDEPPIVVMSDVGSGPSVADALLGRDAAAATRALVSWATAVAALHRATAGLRDAFSISLVERAGDLRVPESVMARDLDHAARTIAELAEELGVELPGGALDELRGLGSRLDGNGPAALTPADACPDNNVRLDDGLVLIDFEGAQWRHVAWDVAYLAVPWPSCWCSWRIPEDVAEQAIAAYRAGFGTPYVDTPAFRADVAAAAVGWAYISTSWFLARARADNAALTDADKPSPTPRAMILHRLHRAGQSAQLPALAELANGLYEALTGQWGDVTLAYAPAFEK